ncbi:signal peptidase II [Amycolatopsis sp.]|uniref:signal peptidase II n=1 Tax=Amycolatopsis sp. TaxID=37632 RepID=UPI002629F1D3|nr:signal peptidase II [Amycolatopsis sp.]
MTDPGSSAPLRRRRVVAAAVAVVILVVDQLTKYWAVSTLTAHASIRVLGDFISFQLLYNSGAAFSIGENSTWVFTVVAAAAVVALVWLVGRVRSRGWAISLGLLLGGAATHLLDRLFRAPGFARGHVVDFIDYNGWFVGNIADIVLFVGAVLAVLLSLRGVGMDGKSQISRSNEGAK